MTEIIARGGEVVIVDDDFTPPGPLSVNAEGYVRVYHPEEGGSRPLHQVILGTVGQGIDLVVDHINRNKLDNRRSNLRLADRQLSSLNRGDFPRKEKLPRNVYRNKGGFQAKVTRNYKVHHLGTYATPEEAASAVSKFKEVHDEDLVQVGP